MYITTEQCRVRPARVQYTGYISMQVLISPDDALIVPNICTEILLCNITKYPRCKG